MAVADFALSYQKCPIFFSGGIAGNIPGYLLPIISVTQGVLFDDAEPTARASLDVNDYFFNFSPMPGATLAENQVAHYPFANQAVAGNAIMNQPLRIAMMMIAAVSQSGGYAQKLATFSNLQAAIANHTALGGVYVVATPSYIYQSCILTAFRDASEGDPQRPQDRWVWEFEQPLLTQQQAQQVQNSLMRKTSSGAVITPDKKGNITYSGQAAAVGSLGSGFAPYVIPAAQNLVGAGPGQFSQNRVGAN